MVSPCAITSPAVSVDASSTDHSPSLPADWHAWIRREMRNSCGRPRGRVLLVSYLFPPVGGSGIYRPLGLARHLPSIGWQIEVLTAAHARFPWRDETLSRSAPPTCRITRVAGHEPACWAARVTRFFSGSAGTAALETQPNGSKKRDRNGSWSRRWIEDRIYWRLAGLTRSIGLGNGESLWSGPAVRHALASHRQDPFSAIITTGPPHFVHDVGWRIAQQTGIPWIADLRDPLLSDFDRTPQQNIHRQQSRQLERRIMDEAAVVVTTCESLAEDLLRRYPRRSMADVRCILNGFDREDLLRVAGRLPMSGAGDCHFAAVGSFYGRREIGLLVEPLARILERHTEWNGRVRLTIAGQLDRLQKEHWERSAPGWLSLRGYVARDEALALSLGATCNIIVVPDCQHGRQSIPGKTFELLAMPRHVLGLVPAGSDTHRIIADAGAATLAALEEPHRVCEAMARIIEAHFAGTLDGHRSWPTMDIHDRHSTAAAFADCLADVVHSPRECGLATGKPPVAPIIHGVRPA